MTRRNDSRRQSAVWLPVPVYLSLFYLLATFKIISGHTPTCHSAHSWRLHSAVPLGDQATGTMTQYPTQSHYPDNVLSSPYPIILMLSARLGSDKYQVIGFLGWDLNSLSGALLISGHYVRLLCRRLWLRTTTESNQ